MALYTTVTLTDAGAQLLSSLLLAGSPLKLTALALGSGTLADDENPKALAALKQEEKRLPLETINAAAGAVVVTASLSTATVEADFWQREIGLYSGGTLIAYGNAGDKADYIPAAGGNTAITKQFSLRLATGNVPVQYQPLDSGEFVTHAHLNETLPGRINDALSRFLTDGGSIEAAVNPATDSEAGTVLLAAGQSGHRLAAVASTGSYSDLTGVPQLEALQITGTGGGVLLSIRGNATNTTFTGAQIGLATTLTSISASTSYQFYADPDTRQTRLFLGYTLSPIQLLPYGISEPCVFIGEPELPLCLRGSKISIAGHDFSPADAIGNAELREAIDTALFASESSASETATGTSNAIVQYIELDPMHLPAGELESISLFIRPDRVPATESYLGIFEAGDGGEYAKIGVSSEAVRQAASSYATWTFPRGIMLTGKKLRLIALASPDDGWEPNHQLGLRAFPRPTGDTSMMASGSTTVQYVPQMRISVSRKAHLYAPASHAADTEMHLTPEEHATLATLLPHAAELLSLLNPQQ